MNLREDTTSKRFKVNLENCEDEPIRIPGLIQSGYLLVTYDKNDLKVRHVSENLKDVLGIEVDKFIGHLVTDHFDAGLIQRVNIHFEGAKNPFLEKKVRIAEQHFPVVAHNSEDLVVMEFDLVKENTTDQEKLMEGYNKILSRLSEDEPIKDTYDAFINSLKSITGYDRVMLYKFDPFWNGEVIAEAKEPHLEAFLNLNYPHTDIPPQARELYLQNWVRHISDVNYTPVEILPYSGPNSKQPLNLSMAISRSVSPIHIEYLQNMKVGATLVASVIVDQKLWGLISCHHYSKKHIDIFTKSTVELLTKTLSHFLRHKLSVEEDNFSTKRTHYINLINEQLIEQWDILAAFAEIKKDHLLGLMDADGAVIISEGSNIMDWGAIPNQNLTKTLCNHLLEKDLDTWFTSSIKKSQPEISWDSEIAGAYFMRLHAEKKIYLVWFRLERPKIVQWAGNPYFNKKGEKQVLSPRSSFDKWSENMKGVSSDWNKNNEKSADQLQTLIKDFAFIKNNYLVKKIKEKNIELAEVLDQVLIAKETADSALRLKQDFLLNMSHEVRTPLNSMVGLTQMIKAKSEDEQIKEWTNYIIESSDRLLTTVSSILSAAKNEAKSEVLNLKEVDLSEVITQTALAHAPLFEKHGVTLLSDVKDGLRVNADKNKIKQVLDNILSNALKFTQSGQVSISLTSANKHAIITLQDTGRGMSASFLRDIFKPFSQEDGGINRVNEGSGLGLYISKNYIDLMGGLVEVSSVLGQGTTFVIRLPIF